MNIKQLIEERLLALDPTIDLSDSSPAQALVVEPLLRAFEPDALSADVRELMRAKLAEEYPDLTLGPGDAFTDVLINACSLFLEPYRQTLARISAAQNISDPDALAADDIDALSSNWLVARRTGARATGVVSLTLLTPRALTVTTSARFLTADGLVFVSRERFTISAADSLRGLNAAGQYVVSIPVIAEVVGAAYNIPRGAIRSATGVGTFSSVTNTSDFTGGADQEASADFLRARLPAVIHERSLVTEGGVRAHILSDVLAVESVEVAGFGDTEMRRDVARVGEAFQHVAAGVAVFGQGFCVFASRVTAGVRVGDTLVGQAPNGDALRAKVEALLSGPAEDVLVEGYVGYVARIDARYDAPVIGYVSVLRPDVVEIGGQEISSEVHLGGRVDAYINPVSDALQTDALSLTPLAGITGSGVAFDGRKVTLDGLAGRARRGQYLVFEAASVRRAAWITDVEGDVVYTDTALTDIPVTSTWRVCDAVEVPLISEPLTLAQGSVELRIGSRVARASAELLRDVEAGDTLRVIDTNTEYTIESLSLTSCVLTSPSSVTGQFLGRFERARQGAATPVTQVHALSVGDEQLTYGECVGVHVLTASDAQEVRAGGMCRVSPKLHALYPEGLASLEMTGSDYTVAIPRLNTLSLRVAGRTGYHFGSETPRAGSGVINVQLKALVANNAPYMQAELPLDLFVPGAYNVVVAYGDLDPDLVISAAAAYYARQAGADALLAAAIPVDMPRPAPAMGGEVLHAFGGSWVIDREYPLDIVFSEPVVETTNSVILTSVDHSRTLRLSVLRLHELVDAPLLSAGEADMARLDQVPSQSISLPDLLRALLSPHTLMSGAELSAQITDLVEGEGLTSASVPPVNLLGDADTALFTLTRPSTGTARFYFESPRTVEARAPHFTRYSHAEAIARIGSGEARASRPFFHAQDLRVRAERGAVYGGDDPRAWPRGADLRAVQSEALPLADYTFAEYVGVYDEHEGLMDKVALTLDKPAAVAVDVRAGDELHVLQRSFTIESYPPAVVSVHFVLRMRQTNDTTLGELLQSGAIYDFFVDSSGEPLPRAVLDRAVRADGMSVAGFIQELASLSPDGQVNTQDLAEPLSCGSRDIFFAIEPTSEKLSRPYVSATALSNRVELVRLYEDHQLDVDATITRDLMRVLTSEDASDVSDTIREVDTATGTISIDRALSLSTAPILARGWGRVLAEKPDQLIVEGAMIGGPLNTGGRTTPMAGDNFSGVGAGGTTRLLTRADQGLHLTLINTTLHPERGTSALSAGVQQIDFGTYKIQSVREDSGFDVPLNISRTYRSRVSLSESLSLPEGVEYIDVFFLLTDRVPSDVSALKACRAVDVYAREPLAFKINAVPRVEDGYVFVSTLDDESASAQGIGPLRRAAIEGEPYNPTICDALPFAIVRPGAYTLRAETPLAGLYYADAPFVSVAEAGVSAGEARLTTSPLQTSGFSMRARGETFSVDDSPIVTYAPVVWEGGARTERMPLEGSVRYTRALPVSDAAQRFASPRSRVLCSDLLARRMLPAAIGVYMRYTGGSSEVIVREDVRKYIEGQARGRAPIDVSDLVGLVYRRGVDRVLSPTHVIVYVEDLDRRRHALVVTDRFDVDTDVFYAGTARVTAARAPSASTLAVTLDILKV